MYTIMLIEDEPDFRKMMATAFRGEGWETLPFGSGEEALEALAEADPDLVLLDVNLPGIDGFEVCRRIKSDPALSRFPLIMITGRARAVEDKVKMLSIGADDYVLKPFSPKELVLRIKTILRASVRP